MGGTSHQLQPSLALPDMRWRTWWGAAHDTVLFCSSEAVEDGCGHAGTAGHGDAGPAPGSWEVGWEEGKGPPGEEEVPSKRAGASGTGWRASSVFSVSFPLLQVGNLGLLFMLLFFIFAALGVELFGDLGELRFGDDGGARDGDQEGS